MIWTSPATTERQHITCARDHNGINPNNAVWTTTQAGSGYQVLIGPFIEQVPSPPFSEFHRGSMTIVTPPLPQDGDIEVQFNSNKWVNSSGVTRTLNAINDSYWETRTIAITKMNGNNGHVVLAEVTNADNDSGLIYDLGTTKIFDGNGNRGSLYERDAGTLVQTLTTGWRERNSGSYVTIQRLVCNEFLRLMNSPIQRYQGGVFSAHDFSDRLVFDSKNWLSLADDSAPTTIRGTANGSPFPKKRLASPTPTMERLAIQYSAWGVVR